MFRYMLIVLDLDGTLLNSEKEISEGNLAALQRARENGALIAFSTARSAGAMREYIAAEIPDCGTLSFRGEIWRRFAHIEATKRNALEHICGKLSIEPKEILAFGDDYNDVEMLEFCTGVAMGNAISEVKAAAEFVTDTNDNDGVARFILSAI